jgi:LuxR family maltose regulon positive regulatory protein
MAQCCTARLSLLRGDTAPAIAWARSIEEPPSPAGLFMWVDIVPMTQARALIAQGTEDSLEKATGMLDALRQVAENCRFACQTIEIAVLQTMALDKLGCREAALRTLEEVVTLAGPMGWNRPFAEAGRPVADLLKQLEKQNICVAHIGKILPAFNHDDRTVGLQSMDSLTGQRPSPDLPSQAPAVSPSDSPQPLVEPLTHRELDVLELLAQRLQNKEIAEKLFITPETVKGHLRNIYQKLDAGDRRQAVEKAKRLGIV